MAMNRSADPCQDFFQFACGTWNKKHLIPEDRSSISTFEVLADQLQIILKGFWHNAHFLFRAALLISIPPGLLEEDLSSTDNGATIKAKLFYRSCMNTSERERLLIY